MFFSNYLFMFCLLTVVSSFFVLNSVNPIQSILFLILSFIFSSLLFILLGAEFLGVLILIVYVGAISILFLFVVMMFNLRISELYFDFFKYLPIGSFIGLFFFLQLALGLFGDFGFFFSNIIFNNDLFYLWSNFLFYKNNILNLGIILYNFYVSFVFLASLILLASMLGVIILTVDFEYRIFKKKFVFHKSTMNLLRSFDYWHL